MLMRLAFNAWTMRTFSSLRRPRYWLFLYLQPRLNIITRSHITSFEWSKIIKLGRITNHIMRAPTIQIPLSGFSRGNKRSDNNITFLLIFSKLNSFKLVFFIRSLSPRWYNVGQKKTQLYYSVYTSWDVFFKAIGSPRRKIGLWFKWHIRTPIDIMFINLVSKCIVFIPTKCWDMPFSSTIMTNIDLWIIFDSRIMLDFLKNIFLPIFMSQIINNFKWTFSSTLSVTFNAFKEEEPCSMYPRTCLST